MKNLQACLYARYSTDKQRETSIEDQLRKARQRAQQEGWTVVATHADEGVSGSTPVALRPGGKALIADALAGRFSVLIVEGLDRISRELGEAELMVKRLEHRGIRIIGTSDGYDTTAKGRKVMRIARGLVNELYLDDLREKTHRGLAGQFERGFSAGGKTYGYCTVEAQGGRRVVIDEAQAQHVRAIFARYAAGDSVRSIVLDLNARRIPGPRGGTWAASALNGSALKGLGLLNNELYVGRVVWNRRQWLKCPDTGARRYVERSPDEWQIREAPELRIIGQDLWEAVRRRMAPRWTPCGARDAILPGRKGGRPPRTLFGGLLRCGTCGGRLVAINAWGYGCSAHHDRGPSACTSGTLISRTKTDAKLTSMVRAELTGVDVLSAMPHAVEVELSNLRQDEHQDTLCLRRRQTILQIEIDNLVQSLAQVGASKALTARLHMLEVETGKIAKCIALPSPVETAISASDVIERFLHLIRNLEDALELHPDREHVRCLLADLLRHPRLPT